MAYWMNVHERIVLDYILNDEKRMAKLNDFKSEDARKKYKKATGIVIAACRELKMKLTDVEIHNVSFNLLNG